MVLVAFSAVHRSVAGWFEGYFSFLMTVCTSCFVHLSRTHVHVSRTSRSETAPITAEAASSIAIHMYISVILIFLSSFQQGLQSQISAGPSRSLSLHCLQPSCLAQRSQNPVHVLFHLPLWQYHQLQHCGYRRQRQENFYLVL